MGVFGSDSNSNSNSNIINRDRALEKVLEAPGNTLSDLFTGLAEGLAPAIKEQERIIERNWADGAISRDVGILADKASGLIGSLFSPDDAETLDASEANWQIPNGSDAIGTPQKMLEVNGHNIGGVDKISGPNTIAAINSIRNALDNPQSEPLANGDPITLNHLRDVSAVTYMQHNAQYIADFRGEVNNIVQNPQNHLAQVTSPNTALEISLPENN